MIRTSERLVVLGDSGSGKSHWAKAWTDRRRPSEVVLIWDPTFEWAGRVADRPIKGARVVGSVRALAQAVVDGARRVVLQAGDDAAGAFDELCTFAHRAGDCTLVVDEAHIHCAQGRCPPKLLTLLRVSRHRRVNLLFCAQRPHGLAVDLRTQVTDTVLFRMSAQSSLDWCNTDRAAGLGDIVRALRPREWVRFPSYETNGRRRIDSLPTLTSGAAKR